MDVAIRQDIVVIGSSAGGIEALRQLMHQLPLKLDASLFIVQHMDPESSGLARILEHSLSAGSTLLVREAVHGDPINFGTITIAPADHHLVIEPKRVLVIRGPKENMARPAINPLFRSAALFHGKHVLGIVLSGMLDDGAHGLAAIKRHGGVTAVQDPEEAIFPSMPCSAMEQSDIDFCLPIGELADLIARSTIARTSEEDAASSDSELQIEHAMAIGNRDFRKELERIGQRSACVCPLCQGPLWEIETGQSLRYCCHIGHAFSEDSVIWAQFDAMERAIATALRVMEERQDLFRRCADRLRHRRKTSDQNFFDERATQMDSDVQELRRILLGRPKIPSRA